MALYFQTIRSSSSGNCLVLWTEKSHVLIDCGFNSQISCERMLAAHAGHIPSIDAAVITHNHVDHISYSSLRILEKYGLPLRIHEDSIEQLQEKHFRGRKFNSLKLKPFSSNGFKIGELRFQPINVPHRGECPTYGFMIECRQNGLWHKVVVASDLYDGRVLLDYLVDADFIYIESNHDPDLLALYPNPNSHFHMSNTKTAELLCNAREKSKRMPKAVMLGHLSYIRNETRLALRSVRDVFRQQGLILDYKMYVAPRYKASRKMTIIP
ncbi:MAG: MBL fold metallo-hydrolase [Candidatus Hermodarchaeia archaeon]